MTRIQLNPATPFYAITREGYAGGITLTRHIGDDKQDIYFQPGEDAEAFKLNVTDSEGNILWDRVADYDHNFAPANILAELPA
jgi:hypothetical protein